MNHDKNNHHSIEETFIRHFDAIESLHQIIVSVENPTEIPPNTIKQASFTTLNSIRRIERLFLDLSNSKFEVEQKLKELRDLMNASKRIENKFPEAAAQIMQEELDNFKTDNNITHSKKENH